MLDEPVANLDPLARREFMQVLMEEVADTGMTVVLSSHLIEDLERACDYFVLMSRSRIQLSATTDELLGEHRVLSGPRSQAELVLAYMSQPLAGAAPVLRPVGTAAEAAR